MMKIQDKNDKLNKTKTTINAISFLKNRNQYKYKPNSMKMFNNPYSKIRSAKLPYKRITKSNYNTVHHQSLEKYMLMQYKPQLKLCLQSSFQQSFERPKRRISSPGFFNSLSQQSLYELQLPKKRTAYPIHQGERINEAPKKSYSKLWQQMRRYRDNGIRMTDHLIWKSKKGNIDQKVQNHNSYAKIYKKYPK